MPKKLTQEEFEEKVRGVHGENYDLSNAFYVDAKTKVLIKCNVCGNIKEILPKQLYLGTECKTCCLLERNKAGIKSQQQFIEESKKIFGENTYGYEKVKYINYKTPITLFCKKHKRYFNKNPSNHLLNHQGCPDCGKEQKLLKATKTTERFIYDAQEMHGTEHYNYANTVYTDCRDNVDIYCNYCKEEFTMRASDHVRGIGCKKCSIKDRSQKMSMPFLEFKEKAEKTHNNLYTYKESSYVKATDPLTIFCPQHGEFTQRGTNHLRGSGCPICKNSKGELKISNWLMKHNLKNDPQKNFPECKCTYKGALLFDFFIPELDLLIEYHGRQHYEYVEFFHKTEEGFQERLLRDKIKKEYAEANHNFLVIPYWDFENIEIILEEKIKELSNK